MKSLFEIVLCCLTSRRLMRRRLQKCRKRIEFLRHALRMEQDKNSYLEEQTAGYRDAFHAMQAGWNAVGLVNKADIERLTK